MTMDLDKDIPLAKLLSESFVNTCKERNIPEYVSLKAVQSLLIYCCEHMKMDTVTFGRMCLDLIEAYEDIYDELN